MEELVEVAHPEEDEGVAVASFHGPPLPHERRILNHESGLMPEAIPKLVLVRAETSGVS